LRSTLRSRLPVYHLQAFRQVLEIQADALNLRYPLVTAASVRRSHETQIRMYPYTIDSPKTQKKLIKWGVHGLITNQPERLRHLLRRLR
jgi:glycerophosphoryl diester phosphodiesterase